MIPRYIKFSLSFLLRQSSIVVLSRASLLGALRAIACPSAKQKGTKVHCQWVSGSLCVAESTLRVQLSESTGNFFHMRSNGFHNYGSLVIAKTQICSVIRINISIASEKLIHHIKNTNPKKWILYRMKQFYRGDPSDFLPSLVLNSHSVTVRRLGKAFILFRSELTHRKKSLLHKTRLELQLNEH